jgi:hypothetical protein
MTVNLKDATEHVSNTAVSFSFTATNVCVSDPIVPSIPPVSLTNMVMGDFKDEALKLGTADMVAYIKNQTAIANSDVVSLKIVPDQLVAENLFAEVAPVQAGVSITNAFKVHKNDGNVVNTGGPTTMEVRHIYNGWQLEKTNGTIGQNTNPLGARFDKSSSKSSTGEDYKNEYYVLATTEGTYGEVVVPAALAGVPDIIPASPSEYKMVNGHYQTITSMKADKVPDSEPVVYRALFRENNVKLEDNFGNETSPSLPVVLLSTNGTVYNHPDMRANETEGDMSFVTYEQTSFVGGDDDDLVHVFIEEPMLNDPLITVEVPVNKELTEIKLDVESNKIPAGGVVPVRVTSWDQFGKLYAHSKGIFLGIDADSSVAVRVFYVDANGDEIGPIANNTLINNVNGRSVLEVYALGTGNFTLNVRDADNAITASQTFEITGEFEDFTVDPTEVIVISGYTAEVTLAGGTPPCLPVFADEGIATVTINPECTAATIVSAEEAETTITVTDADDRIVTVSVKVINFGKCDECEGEGNVYVDGECKELPDTGGGSDGGSIAITPDGQFIASEAMFSGGWSDGGEYQTSLTSLTISKKGADVSAAEIIRFDPAHDGQEVEILLILSVKLSQFGSTYWYFANEAGKFVGPTLALDIAALEPFMTHDVVKDEPLVMGPYDLDNLILPIAEFAFYFGYRTSEGTIYFSGVPITLIVR